MIVVGTVDVKMLCSKIVFVHIQKYSEAFENAHGFELSAGAFEAV